MSTTHDFIALVLEDAKDGYVKVEHRNKFLLGDKLEALSTTCLNKELLIEEIKDEKGNNLEEVKRVKQNVYIKTSLNLKAGDILRKKI